MTCDTWHVTCDRRQVEGGKPSRKISALKVWELEVTPDIKHVTPDT